LADFDYIMENLKEMLSYLHDEELKRELNSIKSDLSEIYTNIIDQDLSHETHEIIDDFVSTINNNGYNVLKDKILDTVKKSNKIKKLSDINDEKLHASCKEFIKKIQQRYNITIIHGELENYYKEPLLQKFKDNSIKSKETKPIFLVSTLIDKDYSIDHWIDDSEYREFMKIVANSVLSAK